MNQSLYSAQTHFGSFLAAKWWFQPVLSHNRLQISLKSFTKVERLSPFIKTLVPEDSKCFDTLQRQRLSMTQSI